MDWTESAILRLIDFWRQGLSVSQIAQALGCRKSQISGKTSRLIKAGRIQGRGSPLGKCPAKKARPAPAPNWKRQLSHSSALLQPPVLSARPVTRSNSRDLCCWLISHEKRGFPVYCEAPVIAGKPYCEAHCRAAYVAKSAEAA